MDLPQLREVVGVSGLDWPAGFEELAEGVDSRGVLPRTDGPQSRLATGVSPADD